MKIGGVQVSGPSEEILVLPRDPQPLVFRAQAVPNMDTFFALCPEPKAPGILTKDGVVPDEKDAGYLSVLKSHNDQRLAYMVIKTLEPSQIEWDSVRLDNPKTWSGWEKELKSAGLTHIEVQRVIQLVLDANALNEDKLVKAREVFLRGRVQAQENSCSPSTEPGNSQSGEPASVSA